MRPISKPTTTTANRHRELPITTFKNSLRAWQARYKARRAVEAPIDKTPNQTVSA